MRCADGMNGRVNRRSRYEVSMAKISLHLSAAVLGLALFALAGGAMLPTRVVDSADAKNGVVDAGQIGALATTLCYHTHPSSPSTFPLLLASLETDSFRHDIEFCLH